MKIVLTVAGIVSIGTALGATICFGVLKNNSPAMQPTPTIAQIPTSVVTLTPVPTVTPDTDTSDWKTYKNDKYGIDASDIIRTFRFLE